MREVTERDLRMPEFRDADPSDLEFRDDGKLVRKDRWESGFLYIASIIGWSRRDYEIPEVVEEVRRRLDCGVDGDDEYDSWEIVRVTPEPKQKLAGGFVGYLNDMGTHQKLSFAPLPGAFEIFELTHRVIDGVQPTSALELQHGWKLVPVEPTPAMIEAGREYVECAIEGNAVFAYRAMLNAAPHADGVRSSIDWLGLALDLEAQAKCVESQTVERAMFAGAHGLRLMGAHAHGVDQPDGGRR